MAVRVLIKTGPPRPFADRRRPPSLLLSGVPRLRVPVAPDSNLRRIKEPVRIGLNEAQIGFLKDRICVLCPQIRVTSVGGGGGGK